MLNYKFVSHLVESKCRLEILPAERVKVDNGKCVSLTEVPRERCAGGCESGATNTLEMGNELYSFGDSTCKCCGPSDTYTEEISMECATIGVPRFITTALYTRIRSCDCKACQG